MPQGIVLPASVESLVMTYILHITMQYSTAQCTTSSNNVQVSAIISRTAPFRLDVLVMYIEHCLAFHQM